MKKNKQTNKYVWLAHILTQLRLLDPYFCSLRWVFRITKHLLDIIDILVLLQVSLWAMLKVNVKFKLKLFNLGWFEISFFSST